MNAGYPYIWSFYLNVIAMAASQRTLLILAVLVAVGGGSCSDSSSEPIPDKPLVGGNWKGAVRLDTIRVQLVDQVTGDYQPFSVGGTGTYSQTATGRSWPLGVMGFGNEIWLSNAAYMNSLVFRVDAVEDNRLNGTLLVLAMNPTGNGGVEFQDSMPFSLLRQQ